jgi:hypothetical protein
MMNGLDEVWVVAHRELGISSGGGAEATEIRGLKETWQSDGARVGVSA